MDMTLAIFRIEDIKNDALQTAANIALLVLGVLYLSLIFWTFADARRRIDDPLLVLCATLASFFPFIGTIVYLIVRPPEFLDDVRLRELEMTAAEARLASLDYSLCPHCDYEVQVGLPALSELHAQAQGALLLVLEADRPGVAHLPVLRGRDERADPVVHAPAPPADDGSVDGRRRGGPARARRDGRGARRDGRDVVASQTSLTVRSHGGRRSAR